MSDCLFCKIAAGQIPCDKVYEDKDILAFKDINPKGPVHILFIPKQHYATLNDIPEKDLAVVAKIFGVIQKVAKEELDTDYQVSKAGVLTPVDRNIGSNI